MTNYNNIKLNKSDYSKYGKVFLILISQLLITFFTIFFLKNHTNMINDLSKWYIVLTLFILSIIAMFMVLNPSYSLEFKFFMFTIFSIIFGLLLSRVALYSETLIYNSILTTVGIFMGMLLLGIFISYTGYDMSWMAAWLLIALFSLLIVTILQIFIPVSKQTHRTFLYIGVFLFSIYIVFDTNIMMRKKSDVMASAMNYYLDFLNIFVRMLSLSRNN